MCRIHNTFYTFFLISNIAAKGPASILDKFWTKTTLVNSIIRE